MADRSPTCPAPLDFRPALHKRAAARAGRATAARYASVIDGRLYTTRQIAERLGVHYDTARERIKKARHPLTWAELEGGKNGSG